MKRVPKSVPEPPCLQDFRTTHPGGSWDEFRDSDCYHVIREATRRDQGRLCAYCERLLPGDDEQIGHFHPKSDESLPRKNWALEWTNLWLACRGGDQVRTNDPGAYLPPVAENRSCDTAKEARVVDGQILAPDEVPAFPRIFRYRQASDAVLIEPDEQACAQAGIPVEKVRETVEVFSLNCRRLSDARLAVLRELNAHQKRLRDGGSLTPVRWQQLATRHLSRDGEAWKAFFTLRRWYFREVGEQCLREAGFDG